MLKLPRYLASILGERDVLISSRDRIWSSFGIIFTAVFLPGAIFIFVTGYHMLALGVVMTAAVFALNSYKPIRDKAPHVLMSAFVAAIILITGMSLLERGVSAAFWMFPGILFISFVSNRQPATIFTSIYVVFASGLMFYTLETPTAVRAVIALIVTGLLTNIFLGTIESLQVKLVELSIKDPLTGALNRRQIDSILDEAIERKHRTNTPASLLIMDVDHFKSVNDTHGHAAGDHVLKELVTLLKNRARRMDKLFRMGGEEFVLFLPDTDANGAATLAEDVRSSVENAEFIPGHTVTISIGIGELERRESIDEWIKRGDDALFEAKNKGRNQTVGARFPTLTTIDPAKFQPDAIPASLRSF